jgi:hypothetical protein
MDICARYLDDYQKKYELALEVYLGSMSIAQKHPDTGDEFITICQQRFADHIRHLISALEHTGRQQQADDICGRANQAIITHQIALEFLHLRWQEPTISSAQTKNDRASGIKCAMNAKKARRNALNPSGIRVLHGCYERKHL